jgi:hypothetical protein
VATQIGAIDFTAYKARSFEPLDVHRHGGLRHAQDAGKFRRVRMHIHFGEHEQLLGLQPERGDAGRDAGDHRRHEPVIEGPNSSDIDFGHGHLLFI